MLVALGNNGIFAELDVREHAGAAESVPEASLTLPIELVKARYDVAQHWSLGALTGLVAMYAAETRGYGSATTELGARLPHAVHLRGRGLCADVTFHASPLFASAPTGASFASAAEAAGQMLDRSRRDDEERQRQMDDDD